LESITLDGNSMNRNIKFLIKQNAPLKHMLLFVLYGILNLVDFAERRSWCNFIWISQLKVIV